MITKPTLLLDEDKCRQNIDQMSQKARLNDVIFRPHFKTHQSLEIGRWFRESGVDKITVSSLSMAENFAAEWDDITVAFPVNILEIETINCLAAKIALNLLVESRPAVEYLNSHLENAVGVFIKIDTGYHRTGIEPLDCETLDSILGAIESSRRISFKGFLSHAGHSYKCRSKQEILLVHDQSATAIAELRQRYSARFPDLVFSVGDTPTCSVANDFTMVDEMRPGNFVFYDLAQNQIGSCRINQIAAAMACPIVAIHKDRNEIVIYGGGVHFSKERMDVENRGTIFGYAVESRPVGWGDIFPDMFIKSLSQEHGVVSASKEEISNHAIGDILTFLPVHSCMTANLMKSYMTVADNRMIERF